MSMQIVTASPSAELFQKKQAAGWVQLQESSYDQWLAEQGLPVVAGAYLPDLATVEVVPWPRIGGSAAFVHLAGADESMTDGYVAEIAPGSQLKPEKHLFEEIVYVVSGRGSTSLWYDEGEKHTFEWGPGSIFSLPINVWHQHFNASGQQPARYFAVTNAPLVMNLFHNQGFVFDDSYRFLDRYDPKSTSFRDPGKQIYTRVWETNFVADVSSFELEAWNERGAGGRNMKFELSNSTLTAHVSQFPIGTYKKGHRHGPGAYVIILKGQGYSLLWKDDGPVYKVDWRPGAMVVPPDRWFHQHFNTGPAPARYLAIRWGSRKFALFQNFGTDADVKKGGDQIEYEDEDPQIRQLFADECRKNGAESKMDQYFAALATA